MYEVNGIELSSSEYNELVMLSEAAERGDNPDEIANARLLDKETNAFNASTVQTYLSLHGRGLVSGHQICGGFHCTGITQRGLDFVSDYDKRMIEDKARAKSDRRHDYLVALFGSAVGFALCIIAEHFIGITAAIQSITQIPPQG